MNIELLVSNPSYKSIKIDYYKFDVFDDGKNKLFTINIPSNSVMNIEARHDTKVTIPFSIPTIGLVTSIYGAVKEGGVKYVKIKGSLNANGFPVKIDEEIPVNISI